jgi:hypothetical protein
MRADLKIYLNRKFLGASHLGILHHLENGSVIEPAKPSPRPFMTLNGKGVGVVFEFDVLNLIDADLVEWRDGKLCLTESYHAWAEGRK